MAAFTLALVSAAAAATLAGVQLAPSLELGGRKLELVSCGVRDTLWIDHYAAGLYVPYGSSAHAARDAGAAKAVRLKVIQARYLPERVPEKYREALQRELAREPMVKVRRAYDRLSDGDVVTFTYLPTEGVTMLVNGRQVMQAPGHDAIESILEAWSEKDPISGKLHRLRLEHPC